MLTRLFSPDLICFANGVGKRLRSDFKTRNVQNGKVRRNNSGEGRFQAVRLGLMRRWILDCACRLAAPIEVQRYSMAALSGSDGGGGGGGGLNNSMQRGSKRNASFGVDQKKLELVLNLHEADFGAMVKATKAALAKERGGKEAVLGEMIAMKDISSVDASSARATSAPSSVPVTDGAANVDGTSNSSEEIGGASGAENREVRGIVGAGAAHNSNLLHVVKHQRKMEGARYALMDALRDCFLSGDWVKAMRFFETAIETACKTTRATSLTTVASLSSSSSSSSSVTGCEDKESLNALRRINATIPPGVFSMNLPTHRGILRWSGGHFYLLLKLLLSKHRVSETQRVWDVMKRIGFVEFHMDTRTMNQCIALAQRNTSPDIVFSVLEAKKEVEDQENSFRRTFVLELEEWAKKKGVQLNRNSTHTAHVARLASVVNGTDSADRDEESIAGALNKDGLKVGDFCGLLRRCTSEESTSRVLQMMEKLSVPRDGRVYSALIAALRQPHYRVADSAHNGGASVTKEEYDARRARRLDRARQWFAECPEGERTIDVYNEMLHVTRGGEDEELEYERLLAELRGAPLTWSTASLHAVDGTAHGESAEHLNSEVPPTPTLQQQQVKAAQLMSPQWRIPPNGRTYEIMVSRCRHRQEWHVLWALFDEMTERHVRGTHRLYQILLEVSERHPPRGRDPHSVIMELYQDMRRCGLDVSGIRNTASVVNAWSATRRRQRW